MSHMIEDYPQRESISTVWRGTIAVAPEYEYGPCYVLLDGFDKTHRFGPCRWNRLMQNVPIEYYPPDGDWRNMSYSNGWSTYSGYAPARCRKTSAGIVMVEGLVKRAAGAPTAGMTICTLPAGRRPSNDVPAYPIIALGEGATVQRLDVYPDGTIVWAAGNAAQAASFVSLQFSFFAGPDLEFFYNVETQLPERGDIVAVTFDEQNRPYVLGWWPG